jgi:presqualene diphosphate synthase
MSLDTSIPDSGALKAKVGGSSFYAAMRLMPKAEREAMFAIYAYCRAVDDIADDGVAPRPERYLELAAWRRDLDALYAGAPADRAAFLAPVVAQYGLRKADFEAVIDGMEMDVAEDIRAPDLTTLDLYCDRVASAVGRLSIKVFGMEEEPGFLLAHHLGRALQLTNILRDIDEDAAIGRLYLPRDYLEDAGIHATEPSDVLSHPAIDTACRKLAQLAHVHYDEAARVMRARPKGRIRTPRLMGAVYSSILREMEKAGWNPPRSRVRIGKGRLLRIVISDGLFG